MISSPFFTLTTRCSRRHTASMQPRGPGPAAGLLVSDERTCHVRTDVASRCRRRSRKLATCSHCSPETLVPGYYLTAVDLAALTHAPGHPQLLLVTLVPPPLTLPAASVP